MQETCAASAQARKVAETLGALFGEDLLAVYLHGSAVTGGFGAYSDVDLIAVIKDAMSEKLCRSLLTELLKISARHPAQVGGPRCIELTIFRQSDLVAPTFPGRAEFLYGEWLRDAFEAGELPMPVADPEITLMLAQARSEARPLTGPIAEVLLPQIPASDIRRGMQEALPALLAGLDGDERNVLLTLARMWRTSLTGEFVGKDEAALWAASRLPARLADVLVHAREVHLGNAGEDWRRRHELVQETASCLHREVASALAKERDFTIDYPDRSPRTSSGRHNGR